MTSNDTTNQSTVPIHIDDAIAERTAEIESWHDAGNPKSKGQQIEAAIAIGCREALRDVVRGEIVTEDKLRADRMTRALAAAAAIEAPNEDWISGLMAPDWITDTVDEACAWVEANPEVAS